MRLSTQVKPISFFKANAAQIIDELDDGGEPIVVTKNGEAKAIVMSMHDYESTQETLALLKIVAMAREDAKAGGLIPLEDAFAQVRAQLRRDD